MVMPYGLLDRETRCFTLVGQFLWHWAYMETALNDAIAAALELQGFQRYIVTKNIQLRNKIKILKASVTVAFNDPDERKMHHKTLSQIADYSGKRNMIAHDMFGPSDDVDGAWFLRVVANEKVDFADALWTIEDFQLAFRTLDDFRDAVKTMEQKLQHAHAVRKIVEALMRHSGPEQPSEDNGELDDAGLLSLPTPTAPDSLPEPTQPISPQTPEEPQAKE